MIKEEKFIIALLKNDKKPYLSYLNELVDEYNNTYHHSMSKKPIDPGYSALI